MTPSTPFPPRAYLLGAPKCGTTALAQYLSEHPGVSFSRGKEPHYYADDLDGLRTKRTLEAYRAGFPSLEAGKLLMEGSVWYLYSEVAVANILADRPDARFVVMLRDPVRMLPSLHRQLLNALDEDVEAFDRAWDLSGERAAGRRVPPSCRAPSTLVYTRTALFGSMVERLFDLAGRENCLILFQEEMRADTAAVYGRVLSFLGLPPDGRTAFAPVNEAQRPRSRALQWLLHRGRPIREAVSGPIKRTLGLRSLGIQKRLSRANMVKTGGAVIPPGTAARVAAHHADDMRRLGRLLGRDLAGEFGWTIPPAPTPARADAGAATASPRSP